MTATSAFLLAFPAFFSIVNPPGAAFIFNEVASDYTDAERDRLAARVAVFALLVMLAALWAGSYILNFFGVSLAALRLAGGAVVAESAWNLLRAPEQQEARKSAQASSRVGSVEEVAFFPLTMPFTTGPGTISVAIALGAGHPIELDKLLAYFLGASAAAVGVALLVWLFYRFSQQMVGLLSKTGRHTASRLAAFLLLCIGVQIMLTGALEAFHGGIG
jgi:multiple antibiotic resistance protein